ncbi:unnamed protein product [Spirodela intermedia]|uniref:Uncharacterized protein n=1 Tax=Spirodela intermedia TaxID=51605 RepID=A0A7I8KY75_SPIIN|nr:unnamed protein product [Spirodela intermedia]
MREVRVLKVTRVSFSPLDGARPEPVKLSFDVQWIRFPPLQTLLLFSTDRPIPTLVEELRESLSRTLSRYYALAGKFTAVDGTGDLVISFSGDGDDGVDFLWAEAEGIDFQRLTDDPHNETEAFSARVPILDVNQLPAPVISAQVTGFPGRVWQLGSLFTTWRAMSIASLKNRGTATHRPSAFAALAAHIWLSVVRAKGIPSDDLICPLLFPVDCRRRLDPLVEDGYFGNCVKPCVAVAKASELLADGDEAFKAACAAVRRAFQEGTREPLSDLEHSTIKFPPTGFPIERLANVSGSPRFRMYDADFGWGGRPRRVELLSMNGNGKKAGRDEEGGVQLSVSISRLRMDAFSSSMDGLQV